MVLGWRAPFSDGGSPVRGYYLDQKEKGMEIWREVNVKPVKERQFKVGNAESFGPFLWNLSADVGDGLVTVTDTGTVFGFQWNVLAAVNQTGTNSRADFAMQFLKRPIWG